MSNNPLLCELTNKPLETQKQDILCEYAKLSIAPQTSLYVIFFSFVLVFSVVHDGSIIFTGKRWCRNNVNAKLD